MQSVSTVSSEDGNNGNARTPPPPKTAADTGHQSCKDEEDNDLTITNDHDEIAATSLNYIPEL